VKLFRESLHDKAPEQVQPDAQHQLQLDVAPKNRIASDAAMATLARVMHQRNHT